MRRREDFFEGALPLSFPTLIGMTFEASRNDGIVGEIDPAVPCICEGENGAAYFCSRTA